MRDHRKISDSDTAQFQNETGSICYSPILYVGVKSEKKRKNKKNKYFSFFAKRHLHTVEVILFFTNVLIWFVFNNLKYL